MAVALISAADDPPTCGVVILIDTSGSIADAGVKQAKSIQAAIEDAGISASAIAYLGSTRARCSPPIAWADPKKLGADWKAKEFTPIGQGLNEVRRTYRDHTSDAGRLLLVVLSDWRPACGIDDGGAFRTAQDAIAALNDPDSGVEHLFIQLDGKKTKNAPPRVISDAGTLSARDVVRWIGEQRDAGFCVPQRLPTPIDGGSSDGGSSDGGSSDGGSSDGGSSVGGSSGDPPGLLAPTCDADPPPVVLVGDLARLRCTGAIVGPKHVLTAAHCLPATRVALGASVESAVSFQVASVHRAPDALDAVLLETHRQLPASPGVRYVVSERAPHGAASAVGYGSASSPFGRRHTTPLVAQGWGCTDVALRTTGCNPAAEAFFPGSPGYDTCAGDSGGPIVQLMSEPEIRDGVCEGATRWRLLALVSRSADGARVACGDGTIGVRIDLLREWLRTFPTFLEDVR